MLYTKHVTTEEIESDSKTRTSDLRYLTGVILITSPCCALFYFNFNGTRLEFMSHNSFSLFSGNLDVHLTNVVSLLAFFTSPPSCYDSTGIDCMPQNWDCAVWHRLQPRFYWPHLAQWDLLWTRITVVAQCHSQKRVLRLGCNCFETWLH